MPIYKILRLIPDRNAPISGLVYSKYVNSDQDEEWNTLEDALNDLAQFGWEIDSPIYGPNHQGNNWLEAIILINKTSNMDQELDNQIRRVGKKIDDLNVKKNIFDENKYSNSAELLRILNNLRKNQ